MKKTKAKKSNKNPKYLKPILITGLVILVGAGLFYARSIKNKTSEAESRKKVYSVHIVAGQSNAVGLGSKPSEIGSNPADKKIKFYYSHDSNSKGKIVKLGNQKISLNKSGSGFGPEVGLSRQLYKSGYKNIYIIKVAKGGTSLKEHWNPNGPLYKKYIKGETTKALRELEKKGHRYSVDGFYWMQGESDMTASAAPKYKTNLQKFIKAVRNKYKNPKLKFVIGRANYPSAPAKYRKMVRDAQSSVAKNTPNVSIVNTDDLKLVDYWHYGGKGQIELGKRFFKNIQPYMAKKYPNGLK